MAYSTLGNVFVPSTSPTSTGFGYGSLIQDASGGSNVGIGYNSGNQITTGTNNLIVGPSVASTTLATGSNNIIIGTSSAADTASASTSNSFWLGGGATAIISATNINGTPAVVIPGTLTVTGGSIASSTTAICGTELDATSNTTLAAVTGLTIPNLVAGGKYLIEGYLAGTSGASGGWKVSLDTSDTLTATSLSLTANLSSAAAVATVTTTSFATGIGTTAAVIEGYLMGTLVVNAAGTLIVKFAQNASNATTSSIFVNSWLRVTRAA